MRGGFQIIFDTNFLLLPFTEQVDILSQIEKILSIKFIPAILQSSIKELDNLKTKANPKLKKRIRLAKQLIKNFSVINDEEIKGKSFDEKILAIVKIQDKRYIVATNDRELRKKLRDLGIPVIVFRIKDKRIYVEGEIL